MGQALAFDVKTGAPIPESEAAEAVASGRAAFKRDSNVYMRNPVSGKSVLIPAANVTGALADGYALLPSAYVEERERAKADREQYGDTGAAVRAGLEGAARGVSFGLSDYALKGVGLGEGLRERAEQNPLTSTGGEIAGTVGSLFLPGGAVARGTGAAGRAAQAARVATVAPRAVARGAEALGATVGRRLGGGALGKVGGLGAAGALEGAAYNAGQVVSQAALYDQELTAEKLLSGAAEGALMGGLFGGGLGLAGVGASKATGRLRERLGGLRSFAEQEAGVAMLGASKRELRKILNRGGEERLRRLGRRGLDETTLMSDPKKALGVVTTEAADAVNRLRAVERQMDEAGARIAKAPIVQELDAQLVKARAGLTGSQRDVAEGVTKELEPILDRLTSGGDDLTFSEAWEFRRAIDKSARLKWDANRPTPLSEALEDARNIFKRQLDDATENAAPELKQAWQKANADYSDMAAMRDVLKRRTESDLAGNIISTGDTVATGAGLAFGALTGGPIAAPLIGLATGAANKALRERGHEILARAANRLSRVDSAMEGAARKLAGGKLPAPERLAVPVSAPIAERYERAKEEVNALSSPKAMQDRLAKTTEGLEHEPGLVLAMHATIAADHAYLQSQLPQSTQPSAEATLTPAATKPSVSPTQMRDFVAKVEALEDPASVLVDLANGKINLAGIEALKTRRPKIYQEMRKKIIAYAGQRGEELPYKQRVTLSLAFDFAADPSMNPANMTAIQASFTPPEPTPEQGQPSRPGPSRKLEGGKQVGQSMTLPSERASM